MDRGTFLFAGWLAEALPLPHVSFYLQERLRIFETARTYPPIHHRLHDAAQTFEVVFGLIFQPAFQHTRIPCRASRRLRRFCESSALLPAKHLQRPREQVEAVCLA